MMNILIHVLLILLGLAGGVAVGTSLVALITVLDLLPRLSQLSGSMKVIHVFELALVFGAMVFTLFHFFEWRVHLSSFFVIVIGGLQGMFMGLLAASLIEVLNVIPIISKRLRIQNSLGLLLLAVVIGKIGGSLFDWLVFQKL
jgi:stage V sporulation protein AB